MKTSDSLVAEVSALLDEEYRKGLVDMKFMVDVSSQSNTRDVLRVVRNVLVMKKSGGVTPVDILSPKTH